MAAKDDVEAVWDLMETISICMLANWDGEEMRSRPMVAHVRREENAVYFLADALHHKNEDIRNYPRLCLAFADIGNQDFVSLSGVAEVSADRDMIKSLWSTPAKAWWDSPDDPDIRVLKVVPVDAQYWDGPGKVARYVTMAAAAVTGTRPATGTNRKVNM